VRPPVAVDRSQARDPRGGGALAQYDRLVHAGIIPLVTVSAAYGAGGSRLGPKLADELGVPFVDRIIPSAVAEHLAVPLSQAHARDDCARGALERLLLRVAPAAQATGATPLPVDARDDRTYLQATEHVIREHCAQGAVVLGRAGALVLRHAPHAVHVRLDGSAQRRIEQAMRIEGIDRATAQRRMAETDRAREAYVRHFYDVDARDPSLYHLVLDSTTLSFDLCVELIAKATRARAATAMAER
jgi:cytidylate kinase